MRNRERNLEAALADAAAVIERTAADLGLPEEPAGFPATLENAAAEGPPEPRDVPRDARKAGREARDRESAWTLAGLAEAIRARRVSPVEITRAYLERIERLDSMLHAFITVDRDGALRQAAALEADVMAGRLHGPLHGVPVAYKDLCFIGGLPTTCGIRTLHYCVDREDATVVARLTASGAITLGKLNMTELALGPFGENEHPR